MKKWGLAGNGIGKARRAGTPGGPLKSTTVASSGTKRKAAKVKSETESGSNGSDEDNVGIEEPVTKKPRAAAKKVQVIKPEPAENGVDQLAEEVVDADDDDKVKAEAIEGE